jgi:aquaglyceroporin related protein
MALCVFGIGANCQVNLSNAPALGSPAGVSVLSVCHHYTSFNNFISDQNYTSVSLAWGAGLLPMLALDCASLTSTLIGIALGVWISNGGHINPAVSLVQSAWLLYSRILRRLPWHSLLGGNSRGRKFHIIF